MTHPSSPLDDGLKPFHPVYHVILHFLFFLGLLSRSRAVRGFLTIVIFGWSMHIVFYREVGIDDVVSFSFILQTAFRASDALLISDISTLKRVGQREDTNHLGFWARVKWAFDFLVNPRRVGWTDEPRNALPPHPPRTRWQFVRWKVLKCIWYIIVADLAQTLLQRLPVAEWRAISIVGLWLRVVGTAAIALVSCSLMSLMHAILAILFVGSGLSDATNWPPLFGSMFDAYTVRRFWGKVWHQLFRRTVSVHSDFVVYRLLRFKRSSVIGSIIWLYVAFALSGVIHTAAEYGLLRSRSPDSCHNSMLFFFLQSSAVLLEIGVQRILRLQAGKLTIILGYVWTLSWFALTFPPWFDPSVQFGDRGLVGLWTTGSITNYLLKGRWNY